MLILGQWKKDVIDVILNVINHFIFLTLKHLGSILTDLLQLSTLFFQTSTNVRPELFTNAESAPNASTGFPDMSANVQPVTKETDERDASRPKSEPAASPTSTAPTTLSAGKTGRAAAGPGSKRPARFASTSTSVRRRRTSAVQRRLARTRSEVSNVGANRRWWEILRKSLARTPASMSTAENIPSVRLKGLKPSAFAMKDGPTTPKKFQPVVSVIFFHFHLIFLIYY